MLEVVYLVRFVIKGEKSMRQEVRNQHYVPQFYLKKFSIGNKGNERLWVFNKKELYLKKKKVKYTASKDFFYDFEKEYFKEGEYDLKNKQWLEENYGTIENKTGKILKKIEEKVREKADKTTNSEIIEFDIETEITIEEKLIISEFLSVQYIRTKSFREQISNTVKLLLEKTISITTPNKLLKKALEEKQIGLEFHENFEKGLHLQTILDQLKNKEIQKTIFSRVWVFQYNKTNKEYCTSDNPIIIIGVYGVGVSTADMLIFPITNKINLCMYLPGVLGESFSEEMLEKCYFQNELSEENIEELNLLQTYGCNIEVYSIDGNVARIEKECKKNSYNIQLSPKDRVEVF